MLKKKKNQINWEDFLEDYDEDILEEEDVDDEDILYESAMEP